MFEIWDLGIFVNDAGDGKVQGQDNEILGISDMSNFIRELGKGYG